MLLPPDVYVRMRVSPLVIAFGKLFALLSVIVKVVPELHTPLALP